MLLLLCRARGRPAQRRTETPCGTPGGRGVNVPGPAEEAPRTPSDGASVPSKLHVVIAVAVSQLLIETSAGHRSQQLQTILLTHQ